MQDAAIPSGPIDKSAVTCAESVTRFERAIQGVEAPWASAAHHGHGGE
ncbi:MAG: hypothetical protein VW868_08925 [Bacteroidota bacterium]